MRLHAAARPVGHGQGWEQVILRWHVQQGIPTNPRSLSLSHMAENLDVPPPLFLIPCFGRCAEGMQKVCGRHVEGVRKVFAEGMWQGMAERIWKE